MKCQSHLNNVCKLVSKTLFLLSQLRHYVNVKARKLSFSTHISSHMNYASTVLDGCSNVLFFFIAVQQNSFLLIYLSIPTDDKVKTLKHLPFTKQLKCNKAVTMFKVSMRPRVQTL